MQRFEYYRMRSLQDYYWWFVGRSRVIQNILRKFLNKSSNKRRILDIGCGTGSTSLVLKTFGEVIGIDKSPLATECKPPYDIVYSQDFESFNFEGQYDLIALLDVLEHLDSEEAVLKKVYSLCLDGGSILITVPAYEFLWSAHDVLLHHKRRYRRHELKSVLSRAGFEVQKISYFITFLFPLIVMVRLINKVQTLINKSDKHDSYMILPPFLNNCLIYLVYLEAKLLPFMNFPFGSSIICLARKKMKTQ